MISIIEDHHFNADAMSRLPDPNNIEDEESQCYQVSLVDNILLEATDVSSSSKIDPVISKIFCIDRLAESN